jgi:uncharacterized protein (DUF302 family)
METTAYGIKRTVSLPYDAALKKMREALQAEGFGVLTEIDIKEKLKEKLGVDYRRYTILGACNPPLAHRALQAETDLGLLLPCNVIVYEEGDHSVVAVADPNAMAVFTGNPELGEIAKQAKEKLERALARV